MRDVSASSAEYEDCCVVWESGSFSERSFIGDSGRDDEAKVSDRKCEVLPDQGKAPVEHEIRRENQSISGKQEKVPGEDEKNPEKKQVCGEHKKIPEKREFLGGLMKFSFEKFPEEKKKDPEEQKISHELEKVPGKRENFPGGLRKDPGKKTKVPEVQKDSVGREGSEDSVKKEDIGGDRKQAQLLTNCIRRDNKGKNREGERKDKKDGKLVAEDKAEATTLKEESMNAKIAARSEKNPEEEKREQREVIGSEESEAYEVMRVDRIAGNEEVPPLIVRLMKKYCDLGERVLGEKTEKKLPNEPEECWFDDEFGKEGSEKKPDEKQVNDTMESIFSHRSSCDLELMAVSCCQEDSDSGTSLSTIERDVPFLSPQLSPITKPFEEIVLSSEDDSVIVTSDAEENPSKAVEEFHFSSPLPAVPFQNELRGASEDFGRESTVRQSEAQSTAKKTGFVFAPAEKAFSLDAFNVSTPTAERPVTISSGTQTEKEPRPPVIDAETMTLRQIRPPSCHCRKFNLRARRLHRKLLGLKKMLLCRTSSYQADRDHLAKVVEHNSKILENNCDVMRDRDHLAKVVEHNSEILAKVVENNCKILANNCSVMRDRDHLAKVVEHNSKILENNCNVMRLLEGYLKEPRPAKESRSPEELRELEKISEREALKKHLFGDCSDAKDMNRRAKKRLSLSQPSGAEKKSRVGRERIRQKAAEVTKKGLSTGLLDSSCESKYSQESAGGSVDCQNEERTTDQQILEISVDSVEQERKTDEHIVGTSAIDCGEEHKTGGILVNDSRKEERKTDEQIAGTSVNGGGEQKTGKQVAKILLTDCRKEERKTDEQIAGILVNDGGVRTDERNVEELEKCLREVDECLQEFAADEKTAPKKRKHIRFQMDEEVPAEGSDDAESAPPLRRSQRLQKDCESQPPHNDTKPRKLPTPLSANLE